MLLCKHWTPKQHGDDGADGAGNGNGDDDDDDD